jgi:hypothetical protein
VREVVLGTGSQYGFSVNGYGIILNSRRYQGSSSDYMKSATITSNISFNLSPFRTLRITYVCSYAYETSSNGDYMPYGLYISAHKTDSSKKNIKDLLTAGGFGSETAVTSNFDITDINEQAFLFIYFKSHQRSNVGSARIISIEFLN